MTPLAVLQFTPVEVVPVEVVPVEVVPVEVVSANEPTANNDEMMIIVVLWREIRIIDFFIEK